MRNSDHYICFSTLLLLALLAGSCSLFSPSLKGEGTDPAKRYQWDSTWGADLALGNPTGLDINEKGELVVFHRAARTWPLTGNMPDSAIDDNVVIFIDASSGKKLRSWGKGMFIMPHGLTVGANGDIWLTDVALHQVFRFDAEGKLLMTLGEAKKPGKSKTHFDMPTDVAIAADGSIYVSDGYGNSRVVKFSAEGKYLTEWGTAGKENGEFNIPHGIDVDSHGNVIVADRENRRVQVFDAHGVFQSVWSQKSFGYMCSVVYDSLSKKIFSVDDHRVMMKHFGSDVIGFRTDGVTENRFGRSGHFEGPPTWFHDITVDSAGNLYVGDILNNRVHKFRRL